MQWTQCSLEFRLLDLELSALAMGPLHLLGQVQTFLGEDSEVTALVSNLDQAVRGIEMTWVIVLCSFTLKAFVFSQRS